MNKLDKALNIFAKRYGIIDYCGDNPTLIIRYLGAGAFSEAQKQELARIYNNL